MKAFISASYLTYKYILRPVIFLFDSEKVHDFFTKLGESMGNNNFIKNILKLIFVRRYKILSQNISDAVGASI